MVGEGCVAEVAVALSAKYRDTAPVEVVTDTCTSLVASKILKT